MEVLQTVKLLRADSTQTVDASIVRLTPITARHRIDDIWWNDTELSVASKRESDAHWKWENIASGYSNDVLHACIAILSPENYLEGAMAYQLDAKSKIDSGVGSAYVGWLATAPRNRNWLTAQPLYRGVGTVLLYWAVRESYDSGLGGRISLQSLPTSNTTQFYEHKGLVRTDLTQPMTGLIDYELPRTAAIAWLKQEGDLS